MGEREREGERRGEEREAARKKMIVSRSKEVPTKVSRKGIVVETLYDDVSWHLGWISRCISWETLDWLTLATVHQAAFLHATLNVDVLIGCQPQSSPETESPK